MTKQGGPIPENELLAYFEGALTPEESEAVAARLEADPEARRLLNDWARQDAALNALFRPVGDEPVPERLRDVVRPSRHMWGLRAMQVAAMLLLVVAGAAGGWMAARMVPAESPVPGPAVAAISAHRTFVVEVVHPVEVEAEHAAHLIGWVSKRLGHDIAPPNFAAQEFRLMGGRVLLGAHGPAALFMYEDEVGDRVSLYIAPAGERGETAFQFAEQGTAQSFYWIDGALSYFVVGDVPRETLRHIALAAYDQLI